MKKENSFSPREKAFGGLLVATVLLTYMFIQIIDAL